jgi:hypothetical protein
VGKRIAHGGVTEWQEKESSDMNTNANKNANVNVNANVNNGRRAARFTV